MKPLIVLISAFLISGLVLLLGFHRPDWAFAARIAMSVMLVFTSIAHFAFVRGMTMMVPAFLPYKTAMVYGTGCIEIIAAIGLQVPVFMEITAQLLILFFLFILPANIYAAVHKVNYQTGDRTGGGLRYLWFRIPLQIFFIVWVYLSCFTFRSI